MSMSLVYTLGKFEKLVVAQTLPLFIIFKYKVLFKKVYLKRSYRVPK